MTKSGSIVNFTPWIAFRVLIENSLCRPLNPSVLSHSRDEAGADAVKTFTQRRAHQYWLLRFTNYPNWFDWLGVKRNALMLF